ncbi:hypothetical protein GGR54DRAFT_237689 [Hypoxylon sp. NC1633]|nr:hypothetical protein GGR54DRAFT_237689 [Hypoxylon sp. NC1633]
MFDNAYRPQIFIITPKRLPPIDDPDRDKIKIANDDYRYPSELKKIQNELNIIFFAAKIPQTVIGYDALLAPFKDRVLRGREWADAFQRDLKGLRPNGKVLVQYRPGGGCVRNSASTAYRVVFQDTELDKRIISRSGNTKRDNSSACAISTSASSTSVPASQTSTLPTPTTTTVPSSTGLQPTPTASLVGCYNSGMLPCYNPVYPDTAHSMSDTFCSDHAFINGFSNWPGIQCAWNDLLGSISYNWEVSWEPNCVADQDQINVGQPTPNFSCQDAMREAWKDCNNGGHGGMMKVRCLRYYFSIVNQGDATSCSVPFS